MNPAIQHYLSEVRREFGEKSIFLGSDYPPTIFVPTGLPYVDSTLTGGIATDRILHVHGRQSTGKTRLGLRTLSQFQKICACGYPLWFEPTLTCKNCSQFEPRYVGFIEIEHGVDQKWWHNTEIIPDHLIIRHPKSAEEAIDTVFALCYLEGVQAICFDSVAALASLGELEKSAADNSKIGDQASIMSRAMKKLVNFFNKATKENFGVIFLNQLRSKIQQGGGYSRFQTDNEGPTGGNALKFYATQELSLKYFKSVDVKQKRFDPYQNKNIDEKYVLGKRILVECKKNKVGPPNNIGTYEIYSQDASDRSQSIAKSGRYNEEQQVIWFLTERGIFQRKEKKKFEYRNEVLDFYQWVQKLNSDVELFCALKRITYREMSKKFGIKYIQSPSKKSGKVCRDCGESKPKRKTHCK